MSTTLSTIEILLGYAYLKKLVNVVDRAKRSIYISMYICRLDVKDPLSPITELSRALIRASQRGVLVDITGSYGLSLSYLRDRKIKAHRYIGSNCFHNKIIVVDSETVFIGSHNLSNHAITSNIEVSLCLYSPDIAEKLEDFIKKLPKTP